jgi:lipopolysaccharide/colanic/teichoic acid biosynthesis glycosyltransferase
MSIKRAGDITFALSVLTLGSPLLLFIALAVKLSSSGPIFFGHRRIGCHGKTFRCWKFRTMYPDAESRLVKLLDANPDLSKEYALTHKLKRDPRVTPLGHFLRVTSLDELPQVVNILRGEMSVIGPRPIVEAELIHYGEHFQEAFSVLPGLSGLWQTSGRSQRTYPHRVRLDRLYARSRTLSLDLRLVARTVGVVLWPWGNGAY